MVMFGAHDNGSCSMGDVCRCADDARPELLTVELPQSLEKQDDEVQVLQFSENALLQLAALASLLEVLLERCKEEGVTVCPHRECDHLELAAAAAKCPGYKFFQ